MKGKALSKEKRLLIIEFSRTFGQFYIAKEVGTSQPVVSRILKMNHKEEKTIEPRKTSGRKKKLTERDKRQIIRHVNENPRSTLGQIKAAKEFYKKHKWMLLDWPSQSPDLNPIEHLWDELDRRVPSQDRRTFVTFKSALFREWSAIAKERIEKLVESMPRRLQAVIDAKGGHTRY